MSRCACGSYAINIGLHGRVSGKHNDLCDVCYWRTDYARLEQECERLSNELNNMRISWGLMQSEREAALKQVERLTAMLHRASKAENRPEFMQIIAEALSAKPCSR